MAKTTFVNKVMPEAVKFNPNPNDGFGFNENMLLYEELNESPRLLFCKKHHAQKKKFCAWHTW